MKDFYKILNINRSANSIVIKKAYRKLALELHPDVNNSSNSHQKFIEINEAYQVLNNSFRKKQYDQLYDYHILNKPIKRAHTYSRKHKTWESNIDKSRKKGRSQAKKYASESSKKFQKRKRKWSFTFIFEIIFNILMEILSSIIYMI